MEQVIKRKNKYFTFSVPIIGLHLFAVLLFILLPRQYSNGASDGFFFILFILPFIIVNVLGLTILFVNRKKHFQKIYSNVLAIIFLTISVIHSLFVIYSTIMRK